MVHQASRAAPRPVLPPGYRLAALGLVLFGIGSLLDLLAGLAGFTENDISGLVSPPRLVQGLGAFLLISGPVRAAAARPASPRPGWPELGPTVVAMTAGLTLLSGFTSYLHPLVDPFAAGSPRGHSTPTFI